MKSFGVNDYEISLPEHPTHYTRAGNGDVLDVMVHQNIRISHVGVSDILDSDHLPVVFEIMRNVTNNITP